MEIKEMIGEIKAELGKRVDVSVAEVKRRLDDLEIRLQRPGDSTYGTPGGGSVGAAFVASPQYKSMLERKVYESDPFEVKELISSGVGSGADLVQPMRVPGVIVEPERELTIRNLLNVGTTSSNEVEFLRETFTNSADIVPESKEGSEAEKPQSKIMYDKDSAKVITIAHWIPATRQIVADAPALRSLIDTRLLYGLKLLEEEQLLNGAKSPDELNGLTTLATPFDDGQRQEGDTQLDTIRRAILMVKLAGYPASGIVLHPTDWAATELLKDKDDRYLWASVTEGGVTRTWRVPVVVTESMAEGSFLVGAFRLGAQLWDREQASIRLSEHHADFFIKNMVAILCEERLTLTVYRPEAFVYGPFTEYGSS